MISAENGRVLATVLLNVQGRDVGGVVDAAQAAVARNVAVPPGYYIGWSGRWENQVRARQRLQLVLPIVLVVIFVLLYFPYHPLVEAAHVRPAVPFAHHGGARPVWGRDSMFRTGGSRWLRGSVGGWGGGGGEA